uniref:Uncharacterized protein LOC111129743 n=1 Tax=Crassostrea virginica TaxID=6565 RepID=A0A8B8DVK5_CRAVI|nr:uncharacterized protein LOC111129743 [Crassostrea virginica]
MADETSNAVIESDITQTVSDGINSLDPKKGEEQFPLHRANKNFDVSLSSEYLFRELTSLVPVPLDSDDEETSPFHESIVHTCTIAHRDEERLLSAPKGQGVRGNKLKLIQFFGSLFSKKRTSKKKTLMMRNLD